MLNTLSNYSTNYFFLFLTEHINFAISLNQIFLYHSLVEMKSTCHSLFFFIIPLWGTSCFWGTQPFIVVVCLHTFHHNISCTYRRNKEHPLEARNGLAILTAHQNNYLRTFQYVETPIFETG